MNSNKSSWPYVFLYFLITLVFLSCGKDPSSDVIISVFPKRPIAFDAPIRRVDHTGTYKDLAPPWFEFFIHVQNNSQQDLTLIDFTAKFAIMDKGGQLQGEAKWTLTDALVEGFLLKPGYNDYLKFGTGSSAEEVPFTADALPKASSHSYVVTLKLAGYFGDRKNPISRFQKTYIFTTQ